MFCRRLDFFRHRRHVAVLPNRVGAANRQPIVVGSDAHRLGECSEVGIERAVVAANDDRFACLISGNDQADSELLKQCGEIRCVDTAQGFCIHQNCVPN